ncbi:hypothetical protein [uncultured Clostridium sp.]|uniref:hypothetical protein n=1 Tax=uncultured Clostridium sp. TaxID=59620 RepID=UPI0028EC231A|nr:hypothetical protein [uncultured Clostridium sp.]
MRKIAVILIISMLCIITGCTNKKVINNDCIYRGENEFWIAEYKVNGTGTFTEKNNKTNYESKCSEILIVTYKKDLSELSSVKHLEISYKSSAGEGEMTENFDDGPPSEKTYTIKSGSTNGAIENKDEIIQVNIDVDGKTQIIELKNE